MNEKLYIGNLPFSATEESLSQLFSGTGTVVSTSIITDRETGRSKGFAFVEMSNAQEAEDAVKKLDGFDFNGRSLRVNIAKPQENKRKDFRPNNGDKKFYSNRNKY